MVDNFLTYGLVWLWSVGHTPSRSCSGRLAMLLVCYFLDDFHIPSQAYLGRPSTNLIDYTSRRSYLLVLAYMVEVWFDL